MPRWAPLHMFDVPQQSVVAGRAAQSPPAPRANLAKPPVYGGTAATAPAPGQIQRGDTCVRHSFQAGFLHRGDVDAPPDPPCLVWRDGLWLSPPHGGGACRRLWRSLAQARRGRPAAPTDMGVLICACLLQLLLLGASGVAAQSQPPSPARILDAMLQDYAYRAFVRPRTGIVFNATIPANLTGIAVSALRLRSGSLRRKGFVDYFEFGVPTGVVVQPYVERVVLVYHNLGNWSDYYYPLTGYTYLAPVLGLLVYDAANLSAVGLQELSIVASESPINVSFSSVRAVPTGSAAPRCVVFDLNGVPQFRDLEGTNVCSTFHQGHISIVVNSSEIAPAQPPSGRVAPPIPTAGGGAKGSSKAWKIAVSGIGAAVGLGLLASLVLCLVRYKRDKRLELMERNAEVGETLRMAQIGRTQAPVALGTRTQPVIENDYAA